MAVGGEPPPAARACRCLHIKGRAAEWGTMGAAGRPHPLPPVVPPVPPAGPHPPRAPPAPPWSCWPPAGAPAGPSSAAGSLPRASYCLPPQPLSIVAGTRQEGGKGSLWPPCKGLGGAAWPAGLTRARLGRSLGSGRPGNGTHSRPMVREQAQGGPRRNTSLRIFAWGPQSQFEGCGRPSAASLAAPQHCRAARRCS